MGVPLKYYFFTISSQVLQILTAKDTGKSSRISNSYQLQVYDSLSQLKSETSGKMHEPPIDDRVAGLHMPRPVGGNAVGLN